MIDGRGGKGMIRKIKKRNRMASGKFTGRPSLHHLDVFIQIWSYIWRFHLRFIFGVRITEAGGHWSLWFSGLVVYMHEIPLFSTT